MNDRFGHDADDRVLRAVAGRLAAELRGEDLVARMGGEEFLVVLPDRDQESTNSVAERIRAAIADEPLVIDGAPLAVTVSLGTTGWLESKGAVSELIRIADARLYEAEHPGRNRVVSA